MRTPGTLSPKHLLLTFLIVLIWGINFIAIYIGLKDFPPFLLSALRFGLAAIPWVFFFPKPEAPVKLILGYGLFTFAMQFGFLFSGIHLGLSPGLASLVLQIQVFFSIGLAYLFFQDKPGIWKVIGSLISFIGIGIVASYIEGGGSFLGLILTLLGAFSWASGNMFTKKNQCKIAFVISDLGKSRCVSADDDPIPDFRRPDSNQSLFAKYVACRRGCAIIHRLYINTYRICCLGVLT
jgi:O-acetylserine/cysteine efflux transporter